MTESGFDWRRLTASTPEPVSAAGSVPATLPLMRWLAIAGLVAAVGLVGIGLALGAPQAEVVIEGGTVLGTDGPVAAASDRDGPSASSSAGVIVVDVDGAVVRPGLVRLPAGSRVGDALAAAGGFSPAADARAAAAINLAAAVADGDQISVPDRATAAVSSGGAQAAEGDTGSTVERDAAVTLVDLDRATAAELDTLPGIGPVTADKILAARAEAPFTSVDDLMARKLVGPATFEKLKALVTADGR